LHQNIFSAKHFQKKCFRQKLFESKGDRRYYWFDLEWYDDYLLSMNSTRTSVIRGRKMDFDLANGGIFAK